MQCERVREFNRNKSKVSPYFNMDNFPIHSDNGITIPWSVAEQAFLGYVKKYGQGQTLERIAERGGFGVEELDEFHPEWREHIRLREENERLKELLTNAGIAF